MRTHTHTGTHIRTQQKLSTEGQKGWDVTRLTECMPNMQNVLVSILRLIKTNTTNTAETIL